MLLLLSSLLDSHGAHAMTRWELREFRATDYWLKMTMVCVKKPI